MKKITNANIWLCEVKQFAALKKGGAIIRGGATFGEYGTQGNNFTMRQ